MTSPIFTNSQRTCPLLYHFCLQACPFVLKTEDPYLYSAGWSGCYQDFIFRNVSTLLQCLVIYVVLPLGALITW